MSSSYGHLVCEETKKVLETQESIIKTQTHLIGDLHSRIENLNASLRDLYSRIEALTAANEEKTLLISSLEMRRSAPKDVSSKASSPLPPSPRSSGRRKHRTGRNREKIVCVLVEKHVPDVERIETVSPDNNDDDDENAKRLEGRFCHPNFPFSRGTRSLYDVKAMLLDGGFVKGITTVEGSVGAGKTTFCRGLRNLLETLKIPCKLFEEPMLKRYLDIFIKRQDKEAFGFQFAKCKERITVYKAAMKFKRKGYAVIVDRGLNGDCAFARMQHLMGNIDDEEYECYLGALKEESDWLSVPDRCILLTVSTDTALSRIVKRADEDVGRIAEKTAYTAKYLQDMKEAHEYWLSPERRGSLPLIEVDHNEYDASILSLSSSGIRKRDEEDEENDDDDDEDDCYYRMETMLNILMRPPVVGEGR